MTQFTSFVAVEEKVVNQDGKPVRVDVPVELPEGVSPLAIQTDESEAMMVVSKPMAREIIKQDELGDAKSDDIKSRLQNLNLSVQGEPNSSAIIRVSGPAADRKKKIAAVKKAIAFLKYDASKYRVVDGGDAPAVSIEFYFFPAGVTPPF